MASHALPPSSTHQPTHLQVWRSLEALELVRLSKSNIAHWRLALQLLPQRVASAAAVAAPFPLLSQPERVEALRFLPMMEDSLLFENFAHWDPAQLVEDVQQQVPPLVGLGHWRLGPGTEIPAAPAGHLCVCLSNEDPLTDYGPSGLVYRLPGSSCRPKLLAYRCKASAFRPHRSGAVLALAYGQGNDKGPECPAVLMSFVRDGHCREILAAKTWSSEPLATWKDGEEWLSLILRLDWERRSLQIRVEGESELVQQEVPFANAACDEVKYLVLYNHTGFLSFLCDFIAYWTDLLPMQTGLEKPVALSSLLGLRDVAIACRTHTHPTPCNPPIASEPTPFVSALELPEYLRPSEGVQPEAGDPVMKKTMILRVEEWCNSLGALVLEKLQELSGNFKYIVNISLMEKKGAGFHTSSSTFWDPESDSATSYRWENKALTCVVQVFGIGM
ncbi:Dynein light chain Tctex-type (TCTEX-1 protein homolog) [Durusdinium trenchii]|uniref:Dynein light chain Tctex-type (TCTEX-1 protein homolog) n=1 Tax=Durusdinium trenchii TaxID=1381693 RepID=A0ABP0Q3K1_9DINO